MKYPIWMGRDILKSGLDFLSRSIVLRPGGWSIFWFVVSWLEASFLLGRIERFETSLDPRSCSRKSCFHEPWPYHQWWLYLDQCLSGVCPLTLLRRIRENIVEVYILSLDRFWSLRVRVLDAILTEVWRLIVAWLSSLLPVIVWVFRQTKPSHVFLHVFPDDVVGYLRGAELRWHFLEILWGGHGGMGKTIRPDFGNSDVDF